MTSCSQRLAALAFLAVSGALLSAACANPAQDTQVPGFVQAAQKPNGSGVEVRYRLLDKPALGQPARVEVAFSGVKDAAGGSVRFTVDAGLRLQGDAGATTNLPAGETVTLTVSVVPQAQGLAYLNVFTSQRGRTSSTSIPIQTGAGPARKAGAAQLREAADGEKLLLVPVK